MGLVIAEHFANHVRSIHTVLVAHVGTSQISIALFKAKHIAVCLALLLQSANLLTDELETGQNINGAYPVVTSNLFSSFSARYFSIYSS